ncbi:MAG: hypothetical protein COB15_04975 [Flavobacteriales bacterium]|nr:MAG: hypothetical protein COB15_04975 [Flavobacteriales bacterium]
MLLNKSRKRHLAKTITWRALGSLDTMIIAWAVSGDPLVGLSIGGTEVLTKMVFYYFHERIWFRINWGAKKRHLVKTLTWRTLATTDTMLLAWLISGDPVIGFKIGGIEIFTKLFLYYFHEKLWYKSDFGVKTIRKKNE